MKNVFHYLLILLVFSCVDVFSQSSIPSIAQTPDVLPPSPTAGELGKYGLVPVGLSTGTPNISIPINNFSTKNLSIPISLSYNSNGIKVDQLASWVGMGWSLNCGGVITRVVRDNPDEFAPHTELYPYPENFNSDNIKALRYLEEAGLRGDALDTEKDLYSFNFVGNTGKFVFNKYGTPVVMPYQNIKIQWIETSSITGYFVVTTPDGIKYTFDEVEASTTTGGPPNQKGYDYIQTSWYLTKIEHPLGDVIDLTYKEKDYHYAYAISQTITRRLNEALCSSENLCSKVDDDTTPYGLHVFGKHIKKIEASGYGSIEFISSLNRTDLDDYELDDILVKDFNGQTMKRYSFNYGFTPGRMFLESFSEEDRYGIQVKNYSFDYEDKSSLPPRLSFNQDHWGFYNGADNDYFVPKEMTRTDHNSQHLFVGIGGDREPNSTYSKKGILNKITYPTGGWSAFDWEANTIYGDKTIYPTPTPKNLTCNGDYSGPVTKQIEITSPMDQTIEYSFSASLLPGHQDPGNSIGAQLNIWDITDNKFIRGLKLNLGENHLNYLNLTTGHTYRFQLIAEAEPVSSYLFFDYYETAAQTTQDNVEIGGLRIAKMINHDPTTNKNEETNYYYAKHDLLSQSSGKVLSTEPEYLNEYFTKPKCFISEGEHDFYLAHCDYVALHSDNKNNLLQTNGANVFYQYVTVSKGANSENGIEEHEFIINFDTPGQVVWGGGILRNSTFSNSGWNHGLEQSLRTFKKKPDGSFLLVKKIFNNYVLDPEHYQEVPSLITRKVYEPNDKVNKTIIECDASNIGPTIAIYECIHPYHQHEYTVGEFQGKTSYYCYKNSSKDNSFLLDWSDHPCFQKTEGETIILEYELDYVDAVEYKNISHWFYLKNRVETIYDQNGQNPIVTETSFNYDNKDHVQLTSISTKTSKERIQEVITKYPGDYDSDAIPIIDDLKKNYIINVPIKQEVILGGNQVAGEIVIYNSLGQPVELHKYESDELKNPVLHDDTQLIPSDDYTLKVELEYDATTNNITSVHQVNGTTTVYLWGYDHAYPVFKIENASESSVMSKLDATDISNLEGTPTITQIKAIHDKLIALPNSMVYGYSYEPLLGKPFRGITAGFDPNGLKVAYEYDDFGRLKYIKDYEGNIVQANEYNYK